MFGLSGSHILIVVIILLIFGPRKLPELGNTLGKALKNFKDSLNDVKQASYRTLDDNEPPPTVSQADAEKDADQDKTKKS